MTETSPEAERQERFAAEVERALAVHQSSSSADKLRAVDALQLRITVEIRERRRAKGLEQSVVGFIDEDEVPATVIAEVLRNASDAADAALRLSRIFKLFGAR